MSNIQKQTIEEFLSTLSSSDPTPGGGTVAALGAGIAAALIAMVARLTIGKKRYEASQERMKELLPRVLRLQKECLHLADEDSKAFTQVMQAFALPKQDPQRKEKIQESLKKAVEVPLAVYKICNELLSWTKDISELGNKNAFSDAKSAEYFALAAKMAAQENVIINLTSITDDEWKKKLEFPPFT